MKQSKLRIAGWLLFLLAGLIFCGQIVFLFLPTIYPQVEYTDNRLFYFFNISFAVFLSLALLFLLGLSKMWRLFVVVCLGLFAIVNTWMLVSTNQQVRNIISISPNFKEVLVIKKQTNTQTATYYRSRFGILAMPHQTLPEDLKSSPKIKWLANDIAAVTYKTSDDNLQQFIATYGDRGDGTSYYEVGAVTSGEWRGDGVEVINHPEGITVITNGTSETFSWEETIQYGTLAIVLMKENQAVWTIALDKNFDAEAINDGRQQTGNIMLYKATMSDIKPIVLAKGRLK
ncbi:hypothetical protein [Virgibacillus dokdonensis]|uniref:Uncharacterized protein n=1 Tax=Virgibacillus dokdonensis TaxID=302167 RepID=A0A2K9J3G2_9BACI|nr:hypothetical protein [Virgibacillus dokdonensis]AUJ26479.1 hypothetical protein A21D_03445 [Virgibacillus dokdonensis]